MKTPTPNQVMIARNDPDDESSFDDGNISSNRSVAQAVPAVNEEDHDVKKIETF